MSVDPIDSWWTPMVDPLDIRVLGKLGEELTECGTARERCALQGIDERDPATGELNREWLEDEAADVIACIETAVEHFALNRERIDARVVAKKARYARWHAQFRSAERAVHERVARALYAFDTMPSRVVQWGEIDPAERARLMNRAHDAVLASRGVRDVARTEAPYKPEDFK